MPDDLYCPAILDDLLRRDVFGLGIHLRDRPILAEHALQVTAVGAQGNYLATREEM